MVLSLKKLAARNQHFSDWMSPDEREIIEKGWESFKWDFLEKYRQQAIDNVAKQDLRLYRIITDTSMYLKYIPDTKHITALKGFIKMWEDIGNQAVVDALKVRLAEAQYEEPEVFVEEPIPELNQDEYSFVQYEDEPATQRSLYAKLLHFSNVFVKVVRG